MHPLFQVAYKCFWTLTAWHAFSPGPADLLRRLLRRLCRRIKVDQLGPKKLKNLKKCLKLLRKTPGVFAVFFCVCVCMCACLSTGVDFVDFSTNPPFEFLAWFSLDWGPWWVQMELELLFRSSFHLFYPSFLEKPLGEFLGDFLVDWHWLTLN